MYKHKLNGAIYEPKKSIEGGCIFYANGGHGKYRYMGATVFLSNEDIANFLEFAK